MIKRILLFSDTHGLHRKLQFPNDIDIALFAGDAGTTFSPVNNVYNMLDFIDWYASLPIPDKVWIAGNHCTSIEAGLVDAKKLSEEKGLIYLMHESVELHGLKIFGSPYTPWFYNWAFNVSRNNLRDYWIQIPTDTDILITHGGPRGVGKLNVTEEGDEVGCEELTTIIHNDLKSLKLFLQGHIHEGFGHVQETPDSTLFVNASVLDRQYKLVNTPYIITMDMETKKILKIE
jgi:Icc-related predicted phosphoesterase